MELSEKRVLTGFFIVTDKASLLFECPQGITLTAEF